MQSSNLLVTESFWSQLHDLYQDHNDVSTRVLSASTTAAADINTVLISSVTLKEIVCDFTVLATTRGWQLDYTRLVRYISNLHLIYFGTATVGAIAPQIDPWYSFDH